MTQKNGTKPPSTDLNDLFKFFQNSIANLKQNLLVIIDGIPDAHVNKEIIETKRNITNNYLEWLFDLLPVNVYLIASIRKQKPKYQVDTSGVSLFMTYYGQSIMSQQNEQNYLFELPVSVADKKQIADFVKSDKNGKLLSDEQMAAVVDACFDFQNQNKSGFLNDDTGQVIASSLLYLNSLVNLIRKSKCPSDLLSNSSFPKDMESVLVKTIGKLLFLNEPSSQDQSTFFSKNLQRKHRNKFQSKSTELRLQLHNSIAQWLDRNRAHRRSVMQRRFLLRTLLTLWFAKKAQIPDSFMARHQTPARLTGFYFEFLFSTRPERLFPYFRSRWSDLSKVCRQQDCIYLEPRLYKKVHEENLFGRNRYKKILSYGLGKLFSRMFCGNKATGWPNEQQASQMVIARNSACILPENPASFKNF